MRLRSFAMLLLAGVGAAVVTSRIDAADPHTAASRDGDAVAALNRALRSGSVTLPQAERSGYLPAVLELLDVPLESQIVTFSQASAHGAVITDMYPRAIYFSEDVAVAWAPEAPTLEVILQSRSRGPVFYTLDQSRDAAPEFREETTCLRCHQTSRTEHVPGLLVLSTPIGENATVTDHRTPLAERWGSWYVTGLSRRWKHQGNRIGQGWLESLHDQFPTEGYPTLHSDIAALMVFEHQSRLSNLITRARAVFEVEGLSSNAARRALEELVGYMLFEQEARIPERIVSTSGFAEWFSGRGPTDPLGRSLYQLDLRQRLFTYPLSFMIYSTAFDAMPQPLKDAVYDRLAEALSQPDRMALLDILEATKPDFAARRARPPS